MDVVLETVANAFQGEHETELFWKIPSMDLVGRRVRNSGYRTMCENWQNKG